VIAVDVSFHPEVPAPRGRIDSMFHAGLSMSRNLAAPDRTAADVPDRPRPAAGARDHLGAAGRTGGLRRARGAGIGVVAARARYACGLDRGEAVMSSNERIPSVEPADISKENVMSTRSIPALMLACTMANPVFAQPSDHRLGDHPAIVVQRLYAQQGYDYASKFYPHPAWLYLLAEAPRPLMAHPAVIVFERERQLRETLGKTATATAVQIGEP
jgi:hypothetical protein